MKKADLTNMKGKDLVAWFHRRAQRGNLPEYLEGFAQHPFGLIFRNGFRVCLNTDNRLMSDTTMTKETILATGLFDLSLTDLEKLNLNAIKSAFAPYGKRLDLIFKTIKPGFAELRGG